MFVREVFKRFNEMNIVIDDEPRSERPRETRTDAILSQSYHTENSQKSDHVEKITRNENPTKDHVTRYALPWRLSKEHTSQVDQKSNHIKAKRFFYHFSTVAG